MGWILPWTERWHDTAEVVGAIATAIAVIFTLVYTLIESGRRKRAEERAHAAEAARDASQQAAAAQQSHEAARRADEARMAQALRILAYHDMQPMTAAQNATERADAAKEDRPRLRAWPVVRVENHSSGPVFGVHVRYRVGGETPDTEFLQRAVLPPEAADSCDFPRQWDQVATDMVYVEFRDMAGVNWRRWGTGRLEDLDRGGASTPPPEEF